MNKRQENTANPNTRTPTILGFRFDNNVTFDHQVLETRPAGRVQLGKCKSANAGRPEALERLRILTPRLDKYVQCGSSLHFRRLQEGNDCIGLVVYQKSEWNDKALQERSGLGGQHPLGHGAKEFGEYREYRLSSTSKQVNDEVADHKPTRFVFITQEFGNQFEYVIQSRLRIAAGPSEDLGAVFANNRSDTDNAVLENTMKVKLSQSANERTCNTSRSSACSRQLNRLGARSVKKSSPRPVSGHPRMRLDTRSMADPAIHDSSGLAFAIAVHRVGSDCFTTAPYTPSALEAARDWIISVKIERNSGSIHLLIKPEIM